VGVNGFQCDCHVGLSGLCWIAYSGGVDSHVLLHTMAQLREQEPLISLRAIHIHHGLSPQADQWVAHCRTVCADLNIDFECERLQTRPAPGASVEAWARAARYAVFAEKLTPGSALLTAHTQDDQAETVLLQLLRGAGPKGLAAMGEQQPLGAGFLCRPLLGYTRRQLQEYAVQHGLVWIEDESNADVRFDRNFLRHRILPVLRERWPAATGSLARSARHCAEAATALTQLAQQDLGGYAQSLVLPLEILHDLSLVRQRNALRGWFSGLGYRLPNSRVLHRIQQDLIHSRGDSQPQIVGERWVLRRYRQQLVLQASEEEGRGPHNGSPILWDLSVPLPLPGDLGCLAAVQQLDGGLSLAVDVRRLTIRFRRGGERCQPLGRAHATSLKKLFQEWGVPPWRRSHVPLLYHDDELAAVIGHCICTPFAASPNELGWQIVNYV
jgi:tRNA(Ile)-lysidine synthase